MARTFGSVGGQKLPFAKKDGEDLRLIKVPREWWFHTMNCLEDFSRRYPDLRGNKRYKIYTSLDRKLVLMIYRTHPGGQLVARRIPDRPTTEQRIWTRQLRKDNEDLL